MHCSHALPAVSACLKMFLRFAYNWMFFYNYNLHQPRLPVSSQTISQQCTAHFWTWLFCLVYIKISLFSSESKKSSGSKSSHNVGNFRGNYSSSIKHCWHSRSVSIDEEIFSSCWALVLWNSIPNVTSFNYGGLLKRWLLREWSFLRRAYLNHVIKASSIFA